MRAVSARTMQWLLLSDLHFKHHDLNRVWQTAQWIVAEAERHQVKRAVVCGDLLTSRSMQPTRVLAACYRFISLLSAVVPRIHIVLGNHDLAYHRDYQTTALEALNINRLAPYVSVHSLVAHHEWDGRRVLLLPFREEQSELTEAVAALGTNEASNTVAFAHLAINKAITQRYVVGTGVKGPSAANPITYRGLTGPYRFASLARMFTGHFHSHQTITQDQAGSSKGDLRGSITYLGSPLQLTWTDLNDEQRGVVLFNPETLEHELLINPHAVSYTTADLQQVLDGKVDEGAVTDKHVMLIGSLTHFKYVTARDKLLSLGVRSVRNWTSTDFAFRADQSSFGGLGASVPASDAAVQPLEDPTGDETDLALATDAVPGSDSGSGAQDDNIDLAAEARKYAESLDLDESLLLRRDELVRVGQRVIQVSREISDQDGEYKVNHQDFLDNSYQIVGTRTATELAGPSTHVFVAEPRTLTIANFLGVQNTIKIDFRQDLPRGLTFLVGNNGSGKSTLVEAMSWCQFGRCIRCGLTANDVVNDSVGNNCSVKLEFANGYTIERYRKHKMYKNRVIVSLHGEPQLQLEHPDMRTTQAAINELLGTDYETYVRTVVLSHESAASFLNSTPTQRRDLIEASLGLSVLDHCEQVSKLLLKDVDADVRKKEGREAELIRTKGCVEGLLEDREQTQRQLDNEAEEAAAILKAALQDNARQETQTPELDMYIRPEILALHNQICNEEETLQRLEGLYDQVWEQKHADSTWWSGWLQQLSQRLEAITAAQPKGLRKMVNAMRTYIIHVLSATFEGLMRAFRIPKNFPCGTASTRNRDREAAVDGLRRDVERSIPRLQALNQEVDVISDQIIAHIEQLQQIIRSQKACEALQEEASIKQSDAATYRRLIEKKQPSLNSLHSQHDELATEIRELATQRRELGANRELFDFWYRALARRTHRASSSSSPSSTSKSTANFREHILVKSLSELNALLTQVLAVLYDDTRHAHMATGMLRSLFDSESADGSIDTSLSASVLGPTLAVHPSLAYRKRSSGERKRVDLALFFALLQLARAGSAHRAHYVLVDEVFDNLDKAGQAAVVRWCSAMSQTVVGWIVVITHSQSLVERDPGEDARKALVVGARMGKRGTELFVNGDSDIDKNEKANI